MINLAHRLVLTELCNKDCPHCFNAKFRKTATMDADKLFEFWRLNQGPYLKSQCVKLMGGEPTLHPRIIEIMHEGYKYFGRVDLFTNGSKMLKVASDPINLKYHMLSGLQYIINGYTFDPDGVMEYLDYVGNLILHFVIPYDREEMYERITKIRKCMDMAPLVQFAISPDTQVNLFDEEQLKEYRDVWLVAIKAVIPDLMARGIGFNYDHVLPMCFYNQEMLDELHKVQVFEKNQFIDAIHAMKITCCCEVQMGLIQTNFDLHFCNQTDIKIGSILHEDGSPKTMDEIHKMIFPYSNKKTQCIKAMSPKCRDCAVVASCKMGCYYTTIRNEHYEK